MKKILIYTVEGGNFIDSCYRALGEGMAAQGREVVLCPVNVPDFSSRLEQLIEKEDIDFSIGHNEFGIGASAELDFLREFYQTTEHVAILDDAPYNEVTQQTFRLDCPNLLIAYRDRSHIDYLRSIKMKQEVLDYFFLPFGALIDRRSKQEAAKDIDIIFSGMYYGKALRAWRYSRSLDESLVTFMDLVADYLEQYPVTVDHAVSRVMRKYRVEVEKSVFYGLYSFLYVYAKTWRRNSLVKSIVASGLNLTVCSDSWKKSEFGSRLSYRLARNTAEVLDLYRRSKLLLQDMAEFNNGSHCRVADGPLCNAMLVSEESQFLREHFTKSEIFFFDWKNHGGLSGPISTFLRNDKLRSACVDAACAKVEEAFLPQHGARIVLDAVERVRKKRRAGHPE